MDVKIVCGYELKDEIKELFIEYTDFLVEGDKEFKKYLEIQKYDHEIENLEEKYGLPQGRLYIAYCENKVAGCIALRPLNNTQCEMKRLYVKPEFRGKGIAKILVEKIVADAKEIGYRVCFLILCHFYRPQSECTEKWVFTKLNVIMTVPWTIPFI